MKYAINDVVKEDEENKLKIEVHNQKGKNIKKIEGYRESPHNTSPHNTNSHNTVL